MCVLRDVFTTVEKTLIRAGAVEHVRQTRMLHQEAAAGEYRAAVEGVLGREVIAFSSTVHFDPDLAMEIFVLGDLPAELGESGEGA